MTVKRFCVRCAWRYGCVKFDGALLSTRTSQAPPSRQEPLHEVWVWHLLGAPWHVTCVSVGSMTCHVCACVLHDMSRVCLSARDCPCHAFFVPRQATPTTVPTGACCVTHGRALVLLLIFHEKTFFFYFKMRKMFQIFAPVFRFIYLGNAFKFEDWFVMISSK